MFRPLFSRLGTRIFLLGDHMPLFMEWHKRISMILQNQQRMLSFIFWQDLKEITFPTMKILYRVYNISHNELDVHKGLNFVDEFII
jgi:hypothetical protein